MCRATYLWFRMTALGFLSHPASSVPAWCLGGLAEGSSHITWRAQICAGLQMSMLENYTLREIQFILYKVGYLCTVNKYITNLSCLKKVLPFWCLFPKLMLIYKKVLFLLVLLFVFSCEALCTSLHLVSKSCFEKKNQTIQLSTSLLAGASLQTTATHKRGSGQQLGLLVLGAKVGLDESIPYSTAFLLIILR